MAKILALIIFLVVQHEHVNVVEAAVARLPYQKKPAEFVCQEGCFVPTLNRVLPYNSTYSPQDGKSCLQYICQFDNETIIESCGVYATDTNCQRVEDRTLAYPDCCPKYDCSAGSQNPSTEVPAPAASTE